MSSWTDERVATLERMWSEGATYNEIAAVLGISRGCAQGKRQRLGLPPREDTQKPRERRNVAPRAQTPRAPRPAVCAPEIVPDTATTFEKIGPHQCRRIYGEPTGLDAVMCGARVTTPGSAWCERHYREHYTPHQPSTNTTKAWRVA